MGINVWMKGIGEVVLGAAVHEVCNMASKIGQVIEAIVDNAEDQAAVSCRHPGFNGACKYLGLCGHD
jgi:hypothetical protein